MGELRVEDDGLLQVQVTKRQVSKAPLDFGGWLVFGLASRPEAPVVLQPHTMQVLVEDVDLVVVLACKGQGYKMYVKM